MSEIDWNECDMTLAEFRSSHWDVGVIYESTFTGIVDNTGAAYTINERYLIGDVNVSEGLCDCCSLRAKDDHDTRVVRWAKLI